jgi:hypothetical protein
MWGVFNGNQPSHDFRRTNNYTTPREYLRQLLNRTVELDREKICADCVRDFGFLADLTDDERKLAGDRYQRDQATAERQRAQV